MGVPNGSVADYLAVRFILHILELSLAFPTSNDQMPVAFSSAFPAVPTKVSLYPVKCLLREGQQTPGETRKGRAKEGVPITDLYSLVEFAPAPALDAGFENLMYNFCGSHCLPLCLESVCQHSLEMLVRDLLSKAWSDNQKDAIFSRRCKIFKNPPVDDGSVEAGRGREGGWSRCMYVYNHRYSINVCEQCTLAM